MLKIGSNKEAIMENIIAIKESWTWRQWAICLITAFLVYCGWQFYKLTTTPTTYEECITKLLEPGDSDTAAKIKSGVCRQQFPAYISEEAFMGSKRN
jgi:hypothetical protein